MRPGAATTWTRSYAAGHAGSRFWDQAAASVESVRLDLELRRPVDPRGREASLR
jgi:hypothetical protein